MLPQSASTVHLPGTLNAIPLLLNQRNGSHGGGCDKMKSEFCYPVAKILPSNLLSLKPSDLGVANDLVTQGQLFLNFQVPL